jgi:hypothetical protein
MLASALLLSPMVGNFQGRSDNAEVVVLLKLSN